jgi:branched-chain amino acid transport system ATP-binding protein
MTAAAAANAAVLEATGLSKRFGSVVAVDGIDLRVKRGSIHALIGPNGAGKTTVFNLLTKFLAPSAGSIRFNGVDVTKERPDQIARRGIARSFQISSVFPGSLVRENVRIALQRKLSGQYRFWQSHRRLDALDERTDSLLALVGLSNAAESSAADLAYGQKRALEFATTIALDPELLLLDEPFAGMAPQEIEQISELVKTLAKDRTVLMVEHNLRMIAKLADTITVLRRGQIIAEGRYEEISADPQVIEAYLGRRHA